MWLTGRTFLKCFSYWHVSLQLLKFSRQLTSPSEPYDCQNQINRISPELAFPQLNTCGVIILAIFTLKSAQSLPQVSLMFHCIQSRWAQKTSMNSEHLKPCRLFHIFLAFKVEKKVKLPRIKCKTSLNCFIKIPLD